jgi:hypothetical protein
MLESDLQKVSALLNSKTRNTRTRINLFRVEARRNNNKISRYLRLLSRVLDLKLRKLNELDPKLKDIDKSIVRLSSSLDKNSSLLERLFQTLSVISERITGITSTENNLSSSIVENISSLSANFLNISENIDSIKITQKEKKGSTSLRNRLKGLSSITKDDIINYLKQNPSLLSALVGLLLGSVPALAATVGKSLGLTKESPRTPQTRTNRDFNLPEDTSDNRIKEQKDKEQTGVEPSKRIPSGPPGDFGIEYRTRREMRREGERYGRTPGNRTVFLDFNAAGRGAKGYEIIVPDDITKEELDAVRQNRDEFVNLAAQYGYENYRIRRGGKYGPGIYTTSENKRRRGGRVGGVPGTFHTEPGFTNDPKFRELMGNPDFVRDYARLNADTLGRIPGVTFQTPHGDPGAPSGAGMKLPSGEYVTERSFAPRILYEMQRYKKDNNYKPEPSVPKPRRGGEVVPPKREDILPEVSDSQTTFSNNDIGAIAAFLAGTQQPQQPPTDPLRFENINYTPLTHPLLKPSPPSLQPLAPPPPPPRQTPIDPTPQIDSEVHMGDT